MGKWRGTLNVIRSNVDSNTQKTFVHGLKVLEPVAYAAIVVVSILFAHDLVAGTDYIQTIGYTVAVYSFRWRTLVQLAPLVDQFAPGILRLIGLGAMMKLVVYVGGISLGISWLRRTE
jgi:uncharacterized membrane protein